MTFNLNLFLLNTKKIQGFDLHDLLGDQQNHTGTLAGYGTRLVGASILTNVEEDQKNQKEEDEKEKANYDVEL
ncbi:hypothetical protein K1719_028326 [Acacia pycnantha]|nr:hypothetical protein K1719_028326 [Acacia pycnantha]